MTEKYAKLLLAEVHQDYAQLQHDECADDCADHAPAEATVLASIVLYVFVYAEV